MADFFKAGKVPEVWKIPALLRLHGLHGAVATFEKNALTIQLVEQGEAKTIRTDPREPLDEIVFAQLLERR